MDYFNDSKKFNNLKIENIGDDYYLLIPISKVTINDSSYTIDVPNITTESNANYTEYYFFPTYPIYKKDKTNTDIRIPITKNEENTGNDKLYISLPVYDPITGLPTRTDDGSYESLEYIVTDFNYLNAFDPNECILKERYVYITYYYEDENITNTIIGSVGEGKFIYNVNDGILNKSSGLIWMNLDKTQTLAYGIFNYSDKLTDAQAILGERDTVSASKIFIVSKTLLKLSFFFSSSVVYVNVYL
jgi:hypothetical protein